MGDIRRISVALSATLGNYERTMLKAAASTDTLSASLDELEMKSKSVFDESNASIKGFGDEVEKTTTKTKTSTDESGKAMSDFDRLVRNNLRDEETAFEGVGRSIDEYRAKISRLKSEVNETGNKSTFGDLEKAKSDLSKLESYAKDLGPDIQQSVSRIGPSVGSNFASQFGDGFGAVGKYIIPILVASAVLAAPALISVIGSAVGTGVGAAGIGVGLYEAAKDPRVKQAASTLGSTLSGELHDATKSFIGPTLAGIGIITNEVSTLGPGLKKTFGVLSTDILPLSNGAAGFIDKFLPGLEKGLQGASPLLLELSNDVPELGKQVGDMFDKFGHGGAGAILALRGLIGLIGDLATGLGSLYQWSTSTFASVEQEIIHVENAAAALYGAIGKIPGFGWAKTASTDLHNLADTQQAAVDSAKAAANATSSVSDSVNALADSSHKAAPDLDALSTALSSTQVTADTLAGSMTDKLLGSLLNSDQASNNFNKSLITLGDTIVANGGHLDAHVKSLKKTETGYQQNKDAILGVIQANLQVYDSQIAVGISATDAAKKYDDNTQALKDQLKAAGYTKTQIKDLIGQYENVPDKVNTDVATNGLTDAINNLDDLIRQLNGMPPLVTTKFATPGLDLASGAATDYAKTFTRIPHAISTDVTAPNLTNTYKTFQGYAKAFQTVPPSVKTPVTAPGLTNTYQQLDDYVRKFNALKDSVARTTILQHFESTGDPANYHQGNRWGGVYQHAAVGLLSEATTYSPVNPGRYMIAEPGTGGEGFVPKYGNYARSTRIIDIEAQWYGGRFVPNGGGGGGGGASTYAPSVTNNIYPQQANWTPNDYLAMQQRTDTMLRLGRRH